MLSRDAKSRLLKGVPLFADCSKSEIAAIGDVAVEADVAPGQSVIGQGDETIELFHARRSGTVTARSEMHVLVFEQQGFFGLLHGTDGLHRKVIDALAARLAASAL